MLAKYTKARTIINAVRAYFCHVPTIIKTTFSKIGRMTDNEMMDLLEQHLVHARDHANAMRELTKEAKSTPGGVTQAILDKMAEHQKAWSEVMQEHNKLAGEMYGKKDGTDVI
jgi:hypothetical protein